MSTVGLARELATEAPPTLEDRETGISYKVAEDVWQSVQSADNPLSLAVKRARDDVLAEMEELERDFEKFQDLSPKLLTEDESGIKKVLEVIGQGVPVIDLSIAISEGGAFPSGLPRLAVAPYSSSIKKRGAFVRVEKSGAVKFQKSQWQTSAAWSLEFPEGTLSGPEGLWRGIKFDLGGSSARTTVPVVPPELRGNYEPEGRDKKEQAVVLFEVDRWEIVPVGEIQALDPYLLKHVAGNIYAVLGSWDLTDREIQSYQRARKLGL